MADSNREIWVFGDYRNYFNYGGKIYSHTIDPRTGYPVEGGIASASVIAPTCMMADALATALMVTGTDGISLIEQLDNVEALLVERLSDGEFSTVTSSGWTVD
jgi:thiamine biosynthesis lipoprotein